VANIAAPLEKKISLSPVWPGRKRRFQGRGRGGAPNEEKGTVRGGQAMTSRWRKPPPKTERDENVIRGTRGKRNGNSTRITAIALRRPRQNLPKCTEMIQKRVAEKNAVSFKGTGQEHRKSIR